MNILSQFDEKMMRLALKEAISAQSKGEVPVGAVIAVERDVVSSAGNAPISSIDPTAHAEIRAIQFAAQALQAYRLPGATLYVTLEPCMMCFGALLHARVDRLVYGASDPKVGFSAHYQNLSSSDEVFFNHSIEITGGVLAEEAAEILKSFFKSRRR